MDTEKNSCTSGLSPSEESAEWMKKEVAKLVKTMAEFNRKNFLNFDWDDEEKVAEE